MAESFSDRRLGVWITRAEPGAGATAERVATLGLTPILAPLLSFHPIDADLSLHEDEALAFTSINGVTRAAALSPLRAMRVFAVGDATADAAREAGYSDVTSASGDIVALSTLINQSNPRGCVVHPCASETAGDLVALLCAGIEARKVAVYKTEAATALPSVVGAALQDHRLGFVLIHSPKAARAAAGLLVGLGGDLESVAALGLSPACIEPLKACGFQGLVAAEAPTEDALLQLLGAQASSS